MTALLLSSGRVISKVGIVESVSIKPFLSGGGSAHLQGRSDHGRCMKRTLSRVRNRLHSVVYSLYCVCVSDILGFMGVSSYLKLDSEEEVKVLQSLL